MKRQGAALILGVLVVTAIVVAGCGSSDSSSTASLTKSEFIKQAEVICKKGDVEIERGLQRVVAKSGSSGSLDSAGQEEAVTVVLLPSFQTQVERIDAIGTPEESGEEAAEIVEGVETAITEAEADPTVILVSAKSPLRAPKEQAANYGFKTCFQHYG